MGVSARERDRERDRAKRGGGASGPNGHAPPLGRSYAPTHRPTVGSYGGVFPTHRPTVGSYGGVFPNSLRPSRGVLI